jgi:hypothetical protein
MNVLQADVDLGREIGKWRDNGKVITAMNALQGPRTYIS